jgi:hypothetical protein
MIIHIVILLPPCVAGAVVPGLFTFMVGVLPFSAFQMVANEFAAPELNALKPVSHCIRSVPAAPDEVPDEEPVMGFVKGSKLLLSIAIVLFFFFQFPKKGEALLTLSPF